MTLWNKNHVIERVELKMEFHSFYFCISSCFWVPFSPQGQSILRLDMGFLNNRYCIVDRFWKATPQRVKCRAKAREFLCCCCREQLEHFQWVSLMLGKMFFSVSEATLIFLNSRADGTGTFPFGLLFTTEWQMILKAFWKPQTLL